MTLRQRLGKPLIITVIIVLAISLFKLFVVFKSSQIVIVNTKLSCKTSKTQAEQLFHEVRIMCLIITSPERHDTVAVHTLRTWTRHCNHLLFLSSKEHAELETVALNVPEGNQFVWQKVVKGLRYAYRYHAHEADWFLRVADNSFVFVENLRHLLHGYNSQIPIVFGAQVSKQSNLTVGSNYVLSKQSLQHFSKMKLTKNTLELPESIAMGQCLLKIGIILGNTCQPDGGTFFPCQLKRSEKLNPDQPGRKFHQQNSKGLSKHAIIFENIGSKNMYTLEYLTQRMRLFGAKTSMQKKALD